MDTSQRLINMPLGTGQSYQSTAIYLFMILLGENHVKVVEEIPKYAPDPLGNEVVTTTFLDANLMHDVLTGRSVTTLLYFFNTTPGDWYSRRQATVENAIYRSEFVAAKTVTEQIIEIRQTLRYLGVPLKPKSYMFGDNKSVVTSATIPHSLLSKRHSILSYHRVREATATMIISFYWCDSTKNDRLIWFRHKVDFLLYFISSYLFSINTSYFSQLS